jgi:hypothetical protein
MDSSHPEDERLVTGLTFAEILRAIDAFDAGFVEEVGTCNVVAVGKRFAVVPHELGNIDFQIRSQREDPAIAWLDTLSEARQTANRLSMTPRYAASKADPEPPSQPPPVEMLPRSGFARPTWDVSRLERRIAALELSVSGIHSSRTWRALIRVGGVLQSVSNTLRFRRNGLN